MPLKHSTETILVGILGAVMSLAGIVLGVLSAVSSPGFLWIGAFLVALAYPLMLYPHFRERRADYEFRLLHFVPAMLLLLWLLLTVLSGFFPFLAAVRGALMIGWALPLVLIGFALLAWFCVHVLRQWPQRLGMLLAIFVPFALVGLLGDRFDWNVQVASLIDSRAGTGSTASSRPIAANTSSSIASTASRSSRPIIAQKPPVLPHAGGGIEFFAIMVPAATSAAVHVRAMRRQRS